MLGYQLAQANLAALRVFKQIVGREHGLRTLEYSVLSLIEANDDISPARLAKVLELSPSYVTAALDKLEQLHFISRQTNDRDRRGQRLGMTSTGKAWVREITQKLIVRERETFTGLTQVELLMLAELLHKLSATSSRN